MSNVVVLRQGEPVVVIRENDRPLVIEREIPTSITIERHGTVIENYQSGAPLVWGNLDGNLADQADLQAALDAKIDDTQSQDIVDGGNF
jgi:hypothetical protein